MHQGPYANEKLEEHVQKSITLFNSEGGQLIDYNNRVEFVAIAIDLVCNQTKNSLLRLLEVEDNDLLQTRIKMYPKHYYTIVLKMRAFLNQAWKDHKRAMPLGAMSLYKLGLIEGTISRIKSEIICSSKEISRLKNKV